MCLGYKVLDLRLFNFPSLEIHKPKLKAEYVETLVQDCVSYFKRNVKSAPC